MTRRIFALVVLFLWTLDTAAFAQQPFSGGSAAGYGLAATNEARGGISGAWNPALAGISSPATGSLSAGFGLLANPETYWTVRFARQVLGRVNPPASIPPRTVGRLSDRDPFAKTAGTGEIVWLAAQQHGYAISLSTRGWFQAYVPAALHMLVRGADSVRLESLPPKTRSAIVTELSFAHGVALGHLPVLGPVWAGAGARIRHVHRAGIGLWSNATPGEDFHWNDLGVPPEGHAPGSGGPLIRYDDLSITGRQDAFLDLGVIAQPIEPLVLGITLADFAAIQRGGKMQHRERVFLSGDSGIRAFGRDRLRISEAARLGYDIDDLVRETIDPIPRLRAAVSIETVGGRFFAAGQKSSTRRISFDSPVLTSWTAGWAYPAFSWHPRLSASARANGELVLAGAFTLPLAGLHLDIEFQHLDGERPVFGFSLHLSRGQPRSSQR